MRTNDVPNVLRLIDRFYDPLIERGVVRHQSRDSVLAEAA